MKKAILIIGTVLSLAICQVKATTGYQLDSTITKDVSRNLIGKTVYGRDSVNNIIMQATYSWDSTLNVWIGVNKNEHILNKLNAYYNGWDTTSGTWIGDFRNVSSYDKNGNLIINEIDNGWNKITGTWIGYLKHENYYDSNGLDTLTLTYTWNSSTSDWINENKTKSYYDTNRKDTLDINTDASGVNTTKKLSQYDSDGTLTIQMIYIWDKASSLWIKPRLSQVTLGTKSIKTLDNKGNVILTVNYTWDSATGTWVNVCKTENAYDSNRDITLDATYNWDSATSAWVGNQKSEYAYDNKGNQILYISYTWNSNTASWVNLNKVENTYKNLSSNPSQTLNYSWNTTTQTWILNSGIQSGYSYDSYDNLLLYNTLYLDTASKKWIHGVVYSNIEKITYNNSGKITQEIYVSYQGTDSTTYKYENVYDSNGNNILQTSYIWNSRTASWVGTQKDESTYDNSGKLTEYASYAWDTISNVWIGQYNKTEYIFDKNGIKTQQTISSWDSTKVAWKVDAITTYYYTGVTVTLSVSTNSLNIAATEDSQASLIITSNLKWAASSSWIWFTMSNGNVGAGIDTVVFTAMANPTTSQRTSTVTIYADSTIINNSFGTGISTIPITITITQAAGTGTPISVVSNKDISLYPNPAKSSFTVNVEDDVRISVYNLSGSLVLSTNTVGKEPIATNGLPAGLYLVKIVTGNQVIIKKLIIEN
jgi:hypothetical protein